MMKAGKMAALSAAAIVLSATLVTAGGSTAPNQKVGLSVQIHRDTFIVTTRQNTGPGAGGNAGGISNFVLNLLSQYQ